MHYRFVFPLVSKLLLTVYLNTRGTLEDGTEFDASYNRNQPFTFKLGAGRVIKGWDQGLKDMCIGEVTEASSSYFKHRSSRFCCRHGS
jgi:hypothetical protein